MPCLSAFRVRCHSLIGQLLPAKLSLSAQTTEPESVVCFSTGRTWSGTFCMSRTELLSVQWPENKQSKLECWAVNPALQDTAMTEYRLKTVGKRTSPPLQKEKCLKKESIILVLYLPFINLEQPVFLGCLQLHHSSSQKAVFLCWRLFLIAELCLWEG